jgi:hypothetical protein
MSDYDDAEGRLDVSRISRFETPMERATAAGDRADELHLRLGEIVDGVAVTNAAVLVARSRAADAAVRAESAHRSALVRHAEARDCHLRAAVAHEAAALGDLHPDEHRAAARRHREGAAKHDGLIRAMTDPHSADGLHQE